jgi:16S rRNA (cytidine1402-2'-O)-methyltransferase
VGTLYVVSAPVGDWDDITLRARRILAEVTLVLADDGALAQDLWAHCGITTPLEAIPNPASSASVDRVLRKLEQGDVAILTRGWSPGPIGPDYKFIRTAIEHGFSIVPVPGPNLPVTALVVSGLPADSFVFLGQLPRQPEDRHALLASVTGERRTLVALAAPQRAAETMADLNAALGDRPLAVVAPSQAPESVWRGTIGEAAEYLVGMPDQNPYVLVIGGARELARRWDEAQLREEIQLHLDQGLGVKKISRKLNVESGWPRREIYNLVVQIAKSLNSCSR